MGRGFIISFIFLIIALIPSSLNLTSTAYNEFSGVEFGDKIIINYVGVLDNATIAVQGDNEEMIVSYEEQPRGFIDNILGASIGELRRFGVDASQGYTDPSHPLYGQDLFYYVEIVELATAPTLSSPVGSTSPIVSNEVNLSFNFILIGMATILIGKKLR